MKILFPDGFLLHLCNEGAGSDMRAPENLPNRDDVSPRALPVWLSGPGGNLESDRDLT